MIEKANKNLNPILNEIVKTRFFRYFRVNLFAECPFWVVTQLCGLEGCGVCECDDNEIPLPWRIEDHGDSDRVDLSPPPPGFTKWKDKKEDMWVIPYGSDTDTSYVNLGETPESYSGYDGSSVWGSIYNENCFTRPLEQMCFEERVFYKLISGLHSSITTHLSYYYQKDKNTNEWLHNPKRFRSSFENHPDRIDNLYFTLLFMMRAVSKIDGFLANYQFNTGNEVEDKQTYQLVQTLLKQQVTCLPSFDETLLFKDTYDKQNLITQFKGHFQNISSILNCVTCEKCKLYGKMQTLGLGTALKILFDEDQSSLQRNEIIALVNTLRQLSNSVKCIGILSSDSNFDYHHHGTPPSKSEEAIQTNNNDKETDQSVPTTGNKEDIWSQRWKQLMQQFNPVVDKIKEEIQRRGITTQQMILIISVTILSILFIYNPSYNPPKRKKKKKKATTSRTIS
ncbi:hypothetical protein SAMD00019534_058720 [Acytostelium subglobosum LB1]|uniref:hypothetical protein n=1 Tax=Acytostelium subglobosum LB1 TaxID=1410327 RepID=UPI0006451119|nr:hypothetical protein SAMD00019534_058720 [Acytostelium subglobosum LB1]GAM22697.1 hypothetical protein SAMD00019534_058720 [Acytostelium subglobosum LB1]|eukprot:XP_012754817.1 hypothetical protein SAMD00019534_058720 [Acytostelium subglobosum LB1]